MKKTKGTKCVYFRVKWYSAVEQSASAGFAACGGYDRWMCDPGYHCGRSGRTRGYKPCHADSVGTGRFCTFHVFTVVPNRI